MNEKYRRLAIICAAAVCGVVVLYIAGLLGQMMTNYNRWMDSGGLMGQEWAAAPDLSLLVCFANAFTIKRFARLS